MGYCEAPDCLELSSGKYCECHKKRAQRGGSMSTPAKKQESPWGRVQEAALQVAEADSDQEYKAARERLRSAARVWLDKGDR
jgi:hypothetical protein